MLRFNRDVITNVTDCRVPEPHEEWVCNRFYPNDERTEKIKVMDSFLRLSRAKVMQCPLGHGSAETPPLPRRSYLFTVFLIIQAFSMHYFISAGGWCLVEFLGQVSLDLKHCRYINLIAMWLWRRDRHEGLQLFTGDVPIEMAGNWVVNYPLPQPASSGKTEKAAPLFHQRFGERVGGLLGSRWQDDTIQMTLVGRQGKHASTGL